MIHDKPASLLSYPSSANGTNNRSWVTNGSSRVLKAQWLIHNQLFWQYDMIMCMSITHFSGQESTCSHRWLPPPSPLPPPHYWFDQSMDQRRSYSSYSSQRKPVSIYQKIKNESKELKKPSINQIKGMLGISKCKRIYSLAK